MRNIIEYGDYILGKKFMEGEAVKYRMSIDDLKQLKSLLQIHPTAVQNLSMLESPKLFFTKEPDMKNDIPVAKREEYFYTAKIGMSAQDVPAKLIYFIKKSIETYGSPNYFLFLMQENDLTEVFTKGYLDNGMTVRDVIVNLTSSVEYMPLADGRFKSVTNVKFTDLYIEAENAIALVPNDLAELLSFTDLSSVKLENKSLRLNGKPIAQLGNYIGVVNSIYDLRNII